MKTYTTPIQQYRQVQIAPIDQFILTMAASIRQILALLSAVFSAAIIITLSVWVAGVEITDMLGAGIWGVGIIFLGLAVDNDEPKAFLQLTTGLVLLVLAWLQSTVSADYIIVSGILVATWVAVSLFKRLR